MKINLWGTSHGFNEKNQFTSSTMIEAGDKYYMLDAGGPVEWLMVNNNKPYDKIRGIFISHMHADHVGSLTELIVPMLRFRFNDKATCFFPSIEGKEGFVEWVKVLGGTDEKIRSTVKLEVTKEGEVYKDENILVSARPTLHMGDKPAFSYIFEADGKKVLFTCDMSWGFPEYPEVLSGEHYDLVVCEMAHNKLSDAQDMLKKTDTDRMIITHYYLPQVEGYEEIFKTFPFPVELAKDGMEIEL